MVKGYSIVIEELNVENGGQDGVQPIQVPDICDVVSALEILGKWGLRFKPKRLVEW